MNPSHKPEQYEVDRIKIGQVGCDFIKREDFYQLIKESLTQDKFHHIVTLNPEMVMMAERQPEFKQALQAADWRVPDGAGLIWARWYLRSDYWSLWPSLLAFSRQRVERITGVELVDYLAMICWQARRGIYLVGGREAATSTVKNKLQRKYPGLIIDTFSQVSYYPQGPQELINNILRKKPAVVLVAYGAPKQTLWLEAMRQRLPGVVIGVGVGGAFDIISEELPRAPYLIRRYNLEWLWRLYLEPRRLPRIWQAVVRFPWLIHQQKSQRLA